MTKAGLTQTKQKLEGTRTQVIFLARATLQKAKPQTNIYKYCSMFGHKGFLKTGVSAGDREKSVPAVQNGEP